MVRALDRFADFLVGPENPGESIYGLIVIGALLAAESGRHESYLLTIVSTTIAAAVYWLAHAYSKVLGRRLINRQRLTTRNVWDALMHDWPLMLGASVPLLVLLIGAIAGTVSGRRRFKRDIHGGGLPGRLRAAGRPPREGGPRRNSPSS